jgi:hypothetical protein
MGAVLFPLRTVDGDAVVLVVLLGVAVYTASAVVLRALTREEIDFVRSALRRQT